MLRVEERLHAETVAPGDHALIAFVPDDERVLAPKMMQALGAEVLVEMQRDLAVGFRAEPMAARLELGADALEVVELAVHHDVDRPIFVRDRLVAGGEVDDRESSVAERRPMVGRHPVLLPVRPAMVERRHAGEHRLGVDRRPPRQYRGDSTHDCLAEEGGTNGAFRSNGQYAVGRVAVKAERPHECAGVLSFENLTVVYDLKLGLLSVSMSGSGTHVRSLYVLPLSVRPFTKGRLYRSMSEYRCPSLNSWRRRSSSTRSMKACPVGAGPASVGTSVGGAHRVDCIESLLPTDRLGVDELRLVPRRDRNRRAARLGNELLLLPQRRDAVVGFLAGVLHLHARIGHVPGHAVHGEVAIRSGHREVVVADRQVVDAILARGRTTLGEFGVPHEIRTERGSHRQPPREGS